MKQENRSLTYMQVVVTLISMMIGVRFLTFPRSVTAAVQTPDGWISSLINISMGLIAASTVGLLARMFPGRSYFEYVPEIIGKVPGYILGTGYIAYLLLFSAHEMRVMGEVVRYYLLSSTPIAFNLLLLMMVVVYLILGGLRPLVRVNQLFLPIILFLLVFMFILLIPVMDLKNLQPILSKGITPVIKGVPENAISHLGFALVTIFAADMKRPNEAVKATVVAVLVVDIINTAAIFCALGVFSSTALPNIVFPVMEMVKSIEVTGGVLERLESIFLTIFIMTIFSSIAIGLFACSHGVDKLYKTKRATSTMILVPLSMLLALLPKDLAQTFSIGEFVESIGVFYVGTVPAILLQIAKARNLGKQDVSRGKPSKDEEEVAAS